MNGVKLLLAGRTGLSVQAGSRKFPVLRYLPWVRPTMPKRMALLIKTAVRPDEFSN